MSTSVRMSSALRSVRSDPSMSSVSAVPTFPRAITSCPAAANQISAPAERSASLFQPTATGMATTFGMEYRTALVPRENSPSSAITVGDQ